MKSIYLSRAVGLAVLVGCVTPAQAFLGIGDVVTDPVLTGKSIAAEAARLGQTVTMIQNQISAYENMIRNTISLANPVLKPIGDMARTAANVYYQGQHLMYRAENLNMAYANQFPNYMNYQSYVMNVGRGGQTLESKYKDWSDKGNESVRTAMQAANLQASEMERDSEMMGKLVRQANSSNGQVEALQGIGQLMGQQAQQMNGMQSVLLTQVRLQSNHIAAQIERQTAFDASVAAFKTQRPTTKGMGH